MARQKCRNIVFVEPHYDTYLQYSRVIQKYYAQFTPNVEPFGLDECWLDVSHNPAPLELAHKIRRDIRRIFHVTVSIGLSFNKIFAKLGSDLKKPDAVTYIPPDTYQTIIYGLPVSELLGAGRATAESLRRIGIVTIGQLAAADRRFIRSRLGKCGDTLWLAANGLDETPVLPAGYREPRQSLGHGTTLPHDVCHSDEIWAVIQCLAERTAFGLQSENLEGSGIGITVRDSSLRFHQYQTRMRHPTSDSGEIAGYALMLLSQHYAWELPIRAFGVRVFQLVLETHFPKQQLLFTGLSEQSSRAADLTVQAIQSRYGEKMIFRGYRIDTAEPSICSFPGAYDRFRGRHERMSPRNGKTASDGAR